MSSSNKRRKLDPPAAPQSAASAVSAVSALAARRRLAASVVTREASESPEPEEATLVRANAFSVLQTLKRQNEPPKSPAKGRSKGTPNRGDRRSAGQSVNKSGGTPVGATSEQGSLTSQRVSYSSFLLNKNNCRTTPNGAVALRLKDSERFLVLGSFGIRVLTGEASIFGVTLRPSERIQWVNAPHCHAIPVLRTLEKTSLEIHNDPTADGIRKLSRLSPLFRRIWNEPNGDVNEAKLGEGQTFQILCNSDDAPKKSVIQELSSPPEWNKKLTSLVSSAADGGPYTTLVCGPKSAGKSTFSKFLTNRLLTSEPTTSSRKRIHGVAILDLDPGQPEYAPSGTLSLVHITQPNLSAPFTHPSLDDANYRVVRCHALASVTPASSPDHYLESVLDLLDTYRRTLRNCHLLINTPGWILGTGLDLLVEIITRVNPTEVVYMSEDGPADAVESLRGATRKTFTSLPSQPSEFASRTAAHLRAMQAMSYFHLADDEATDSNTRLSWNPSPLSSIPPWKIRYSGPQSGILGILSYDYQSPPELLAENINGMILAAVDIEDAKAFRGLIKTYPLEEDTADATSSDSDGNTLDGIVARTTEGLPYIPNPNDLALDPRYSRTIGLILVRGIDTASNSLQVLTPIPAKKIQEIRSQGRHIVLVHGKFDAPTWAYTEDLYERSGQDDESGDNKQMEDMNEEDTSENDDDEEEEVGETPSAGSDAVTNAGTIPWVEVLRGNQKRPVGSRVWRVRRDLGRNTGAGD